MEVVRFCQRILELFFGDEVLIAHLAQNGSAAIFVILGVDQRIPLRRVLGDAGDRRALADGALIDGLVEIQLRRRLDALTVVAEVDDVEVCLDDLILAVFLFDIDRAEDLSELTGERDLVIVGQVFDQLLGQSRAAVVVGAGSQRQYRRAGSLPVDAVVLVKTLVLDRDDRIDHRLRDVLVIFLIGLIFIVQIDPDTVLGAVQRLVRIFAELAGRGILDIDKGALVQRARRQVDTCRLVSDLEDKDTDGDAHDQAGDRADEHDRQKNASDAAEKGFDRRLLARLNIDFIGIFTDVGFSHRSDLLSFSNDAIRHSYTYIKIISLIK